MGAARYVMHELMGKQNHPDMEMLKDQLKRGSYMGALGPPTSGGLASASGPSPFLMPAEFYKSLLASAVFQQQQQQQHQQVKKFYMGTPPHSPASSSPPPPLRSHPQSNLLFSSAAAVSVCVAAETEHGQVKTEPDPDTDQDVEQVQETQEDAGHKDQKPVVEANPVTSVSMAIGGGAVNEGS